MRRHLLTPRHLASLVFAVAIVLLLVGGGGGCQFIVVGDVPAYTCRGTEPGVCPKGMYCNGAGCTPCEQTDVCDGRDNDCNGLIDDGPGSDFDGDGATICGVLAPDGGALLNRDCRDDDQDVHPGAAEICNGKDDDCDGQIDNGSCPDGTTCAPRTGECVTAACDDAVKQCNPPQVCDPGTRQCVTKGSAQTGDACKSDDECKRPDFCGYASALTAAVVKGSPGVCTKACCQSSDCPTDFVCYGYATGGNYCVSKTVLGRPALGTLNGGDACTDGARCRSGLCTTSGKCEDVCCSDASCTNGTICRATTIGAHTTFGCADPNGSVTSTTTCGGADRCAKGVCMDREPYSDRCFNPCCGSEACGLYFGEDLVCDDVNPTDHPTDVVPACGVDLLAGAKLLGQACTDDTECRSYRCYLDQPSNKRFCSDVCCTDADCARAELVCRPRDIGGGRFFLRCTKP
jgi:Putative metal-binding motif